MSEFNYIVQDSRGETSSGTLEANDENDAVGALQGKGYFILSVSLAHAAHAASGSAPAAGGGVAQRDLIFFAEQLATLLNGGIPLVRALSLLGEHSASKGLHSALAQVTKDVAGGMALYKALERHPKIFSNLWVSLVQAGEMGGQFPKVLKQIASYLSARAELKGKIVTAMAYPAVLACFSSGVLAFFIIKIVPTFAKIFADFHIKLPALTIAVVMISNLLVHSLATVVFVAVLLWFLWKAYAATEAGKVTKWNFIFSLPFFGAFARNMMIERLLTSLSTLIESGVSIINAIAVLEGIFATNIIFQRLLHSVKNDVTGGQSISAAFRKTGVLPPLVTEMMFMGEESGKLPEMLVTLSIFYREQIDQFTRRFTAIIDPVLVVGIGSVVGVIVLSVFLPIFKLATMGAQ